MYIVQQVPCSMAFLDEVPIFNQLQISNCGHFNMHVGVSLKDSVKFGNLIESFNTTQYDQTYPYQSLEEIHA